MPEHAGTWDCIVEEQGLRRLSLAQVLGESHHYADLCFNLAELDEVFPRFASTVKLRQTGFNPCFDTEDTLRHWFNVLAVRNVLPSLRPLAEDHRARSTVVSLGFAGRV